MDYNHKLIEKKWQDRWDSDKVFMADDNLDKPKYYVLDMFPYPSGAGLHIGHAFVFSLGDICARFKRMQGFNVLYPIGYDSLGLPAENAAIKAGVHPEDYTKKSIANFMKQQKAMGWSYDWSRMVKTSDPSFYKWDQWIFLKMLKKDLAYQKTGAVNWCPKCNTVLANEQVVDGKCWRHDNTEVEIKHLKQWFLKTTKYADELIEGLKNIDWSDRAKRGQRNWIGKSYGTEINFEIEGKNKTWPIFTTRPDTIYGVTFMVVSAQHKKLIEFVTEKQKKDVDKFLKKLKSVSEKDFGCMDKEGVFTGSYAINPMTGKKIPIYVGNFVVADYGSGMVMAVPAHDQRDFEFAKKYGIETKQVVSGKVVKNKAYTGEGELINSGEFDGINNKDAIDKITKYLERKKLGKKTVNFKLRDWGISRQRYWGTPIPIVYCDKCGVIPVSEKDLPIKLPKDVKFGKGNPLLTNEKWIKAKCPKCKGDARRETDTMDTFVNSSWYMFRYTDPKNNDKVFDKSKVNYWAPIDQYIGGPEHITMHLMYTRFYTKVLRDLGLLNFDEPALKYFTQGIVKGSDGEKMSKSKGNVVEPLEMIEKFGADSLRFYLVSTSSADKDFDWDKKGMKSSSKFVKKIFDYFENVKIGKNSDKVNIRLNESIKKVEKYYENFLYRKATIEIRALFDLMYFEDKISKDVLEKFLKLLNPICPHITEELWSKLDNKGFIFLNGWPKVKKIKEEKKKEIDLNEKIIKSIKDVLEKVEDDVNKIHVYIMPFEIGKINLKKVMKEIGKSVEIYSTADKNKYDPKNKAKKARPNSPSIYLE